jgi:hypothetical protein
VNPRLTAELAASHCRDRRRDADARRSVYVDGRIGEVRQTRARLWLRSQLGFALMELGLRLVTPRSEAVSPR